MQLSKHAISLAFAVVVAFALAVIPALAYADEVASDTDATAAQSKAIGSALGTEAANADVPDSQMQLMATQPKTYDINSKNTTVNINNSTTAVRYTFTLPESGTVDFWGSTSISGNYLCWTLYGEDNKYVTGGSPNF